MTFWVQPLADETLRKTDKDSLVTTVIRGLSEWFQLFSLEIVEELLHLYPLVAKALFPLHFLICWVMNSPLFQQALITAIPKPPFQNYTVLVLRNMENRVLSLFHALPSAVLDEATTRCTFSILEEFNVQSRIKSIQLKLNFNEFKYC